MGTAEALLVLSLSAVLGDPVDTTWRRTWNSEVLVQEHRRSGSMNQPTLAFQVGLLDAYHSGNTATLRELADWSHQYMEVSRRALGLRESPHSRIYLEWVLVPWIAAWSVYADLGWTETADEIRDWVRATTGYLSLVAIDRPAMVGKWSYTHDRAPFRGVGIAAPGARSWSFVMHDGKPMFHHLDRWEPDWILAYLLGRKVWPPRDSWAASILTSLETIHNPRQLLTREERREMRRVIRGRVPSAELLGYLSAFRPEDEFSYLRFEHGTVGVMHTARAMNLSTAAIQAAKLDRRTRDLEVLAIDSGRRDSAHERGNVSRAKAWISGDYTRVTAEAPDREKCTLDVSDLGALVYHVRASANGVETVRPR